MKRILVLCVIISCPLYSIDFIDAIRLYNVETNLILSILDNVYKAHETLGTASEIHVIERNPDNKWDFVHEYWHDQGIIISYMRGFQDQILQITLISNQWKIGNRLHLSSIDKDFLINYFSEEYFLQLSEKYGFIIFSQYIEEKNIAYSIRFDFDDAGNVYEVRIINENEEFAGFDLPVDTFFNDEITEKLFR